MVYRKILLCVYYSFFCLLLTTDNDFFLRFHKTGGGGGWDADGRVLLEFLELIGSQNCKIPPTHDLKKRDSNSKLLTG